MYQPQSSHAQPAESYWMENNSQDDNSVYDKVLARGHSSDDLMNTLQNNSNLTEVKQEDNEEIKRKYDALLQHQKELESRIQQLVHIIVHEEQPLPQCDLNFNYDEVTQMNGSGPMKRVKPAPSPMDVSPHTPNQPPTMAPQQLHQYRKDAENASQQLIFSQERRQMLQQQAHPQQTHLQQQQTESMLANFSPQLAVDPFWQMNFLNTNTPTTLSFAGTPNTLPDHELSSTPITRKRSNSEPGFGLLQFAQMNNMNHAPFNFQTPQHPSNHALTPPATKTGRKRSNSDAVVFVDEISKARDSMEEKESKADQQKRLVEQQGGYNRDKKKRKYDNMMSFFKFR